MNSINIDGQTLNLFIAFMLGFLTYMAMDAVIIILARWNSYFRNNFLAGAHHIMTPAAERTQTIEISIHNNEDSNDEEAEEESCYTCCEDFPVEDLNEGYCDNCHPNSEDEDDERCV